MKCECSVAAINRGFIIRGATYDETALEFRDTNDFWMPLSMRNEKGQFKLVRLVIKCCPTCGQVLADGGQHGH